MEEAGLQAHDAFSDITATTHIFKCQLQQGGISPEKMYGEDGVFEDRDFRGEIRPCFTLGKYNQLFESYNNAPDINVENDPFADFGDSVSIDDDFLD